MITLHRCLYCYGLLDSGWDDFHAACSRKMFGSIVPPLLPYTENDLGELAKLVISSRVSVTGVQAKLSMHLEKSAKEQPRKFTTVGLWGGYILKPPSSYYPHLPEVEDLTMHLARIAGIRVVPHSLIRMQSGSLAYITRRIDRNKTDKLHMEDMCQITERLTEHKYHGSYEQIAKTVLQHSANPVLDVVNFYEQVLFSFLTGNADMHLKNFSLIKQPGLGYVLAPGYDMLATALVNKSDPEELALTLNVKKKNLKRKDFISAFSRSNLDTKATGRIFTRLEKAIPGWLEFIGRSFLPAAMKREYQELIKTKAAQMDMEV
jgi:serine/threonine-protein kinase HipA